MALNLSNVQPPPSKNDDGEETQPKRRGRPPSAASQAKQRAAADAQAKAAEALQAQRAENLAGILQLGAGIGLAFGYTHDGAAVAKHAEPIGAERAKLAPSDAPGNAEVAVVLDALGHVGPYAGVIMTTLPLVLQIAVNHKRLPAEAFTKLGVVAPEMLLVELETKAALAEAERIAEQAEAQRLHDEALSRLAEAQAAHDSNDAEAKPAA